MTFETEREREKEREPGPRSQDHVRLLGARLSRGHVLRTSIYRGDENAYERKKGRERGIRRRLYSLKRNSSTSLAWIRPRSPPPRVFHPLTKVEKWCRGSRRFIFFYWQLITLHNLDLMYLKPIIHPPSKESWLRFYFSCYRTIVFQKLQKLL